MPVEISAIVSVHREGLLSVPSLKSLLRAVSHAAIHEVTCEILVVLDRADATTISIVDNFPFGPYKISVILTDFGDAIRARNFAISLAQGRFIAFLDGDDIWGESWLLLARGAAIDDKRPIIWHPEFNVYCGKRKYILRHIDMEDPCFYLEGLALCNYWTSMCFFERSLLSTSPYPSTTLENYMGSEGWGWYLECIAKGFIHKIVPLTSHVTRSRKSDLLLGKKNSGASLPIPTGVFRKILSNRDNDA